MTTPGIASVRDRHFAWELFSAGPAVRSNGKNLHHVPVAVTGSWVKGGQHFSISLEDLEDMVRNFDKRKNDMLVIDYEHASEQPEVARGGPVPAAGWIHGLFIDRPPLPAAQGGDAHEAALKALVEWTPEARQLIQRGQYRFFSPSIDWGARDKETGKLQGATLTSGALTNHPFLEELPALMLTDLTVVTAVAGKTKETRPGPASGKGETEMKRLSIRKLTDGPQAGHHGIFFGDELVGYMTDDDFTHYAQKHLPLDGKAPATREGLSDVVAEQLGAAGASLTELRDLVEAGRRARTAGAEDSSRAAVLREVTRDGRLLAERALELAREQKITLADYVAVQAAERALDRAVNAGKILPRDRQFYFRDALERPREFSEFVERAAPVVRFGSEGIGSGESIPIDQEVDLGVRRLMSEQKTSYGKALKALFRENPGLEARYRAAHSRRLGPDTPVDEAHASAGIAV